MAAKFRNILKPWEELTFIDDYMFKLVLRKHPKLCQRLLETILQIEIRKIVFLEAEQTIEPKYDSHGIRLDIYVADDQNTVYNVEMQVRPYTDLLLAKRMRYYQSTIDIDDLKPGEGYDKLPKSFIIFLCPFDFMGGKRCFYIFRTYCQQDKDLLFPDEATKIIISSTGNITEDTPRELIPLINYMNGKAAEGELIMDIDSAINTEKTIEIERRKYMTYEMKMQEFRQEGYDDGFNDGFENGLETGSTNGTIRTIRNMIADGLTTFEKIKATGRYSEKELAAIRQ